MIRQSALLLILFLSACAQPPENPSSRALFQAAELRALDTRVLIYEPARKRFLPFETLVEELAKFDAVFVGESHLDETTHEVEHEIYAGLTRARGGRVTLALEMFTRDQQGMLDSYLAGKIGEEEFQRAAAAWANYPTAYRPLIEFARANRLPVVASNAPRGIAAKVSQGKKSAFESLGAEERRLIAARMLPASEEYWRSFDRAVRGHMGGASNPSDDSKLYSVQNIWDNTMAESVEQALAEDTLVLHMNGAFHSRFRRGAVEQLVLRRPAARVAVVEVEPVEHLEEVDALNAAPAEDFIVFAKRRGRDLSEGTYGVATQSEFRFRLHMPRGAPAEQRVPPLLIWLGAEGVPADELLEYWRLALGKEAAVAVIEPPFPHSLEGVDYGARWFRERSFFDDLGYAANGVKRVRDYLERNFTFDHQRVYVAGEGDGATLAAAIALLEHARYAAALAIAPAKSARLGQASLPDPPEPGQQAGTALLVYDREPYVAHWREEAALFAGVGRVLEARALPESAPHALSSAEDWLRERAGLSSSRSTRASAAGSRPRSVQLEVAHDSTMARFWTQYAARTLESRGDRVVAQDADERRAMMFRFERKDRPTDGDGVIYFSESDLADGKAIPSAPGPFGGITVLVPPAGISAEGLEALRGIGRQSLKPGGHPFSQLRLAYLDQGEYSLGDLLRELSADPPQAVLIVPAAFCADAQTMRAIAEIARPFEDRLSIHYRPGLGGGLVRTITP